MKSNKKKNLLIPILCVAISFCMFLGFGIRSAEAAFNPETIPGSSNIHFPDRSHSTLSYTIRTNYYYVNYLPRIHFSVDEQSYDPYSRYLRIFVDTSLVYEKIISNDYSGTIEVDALKYSGTHTITIEVHHGAYGSGPYWLNYLQLSRLGWDQDYEKIAVFSWYEWVKSKPTDSGVISENKLNRYYNRLQSLGYNCIKHKNPTNWAGDMGDLDDMEDANSVIFLYFAGHGNYIGWPFDWSYIKISPTQYLYSPDLEYYVDRLESHRIFVMVDGCHTGDFRDELNQDKTSVVTATDQSHVSWFSYSTSGNWAEPHFSNYFFDKAGLLNTAENRNYDDLDAFYYAEDECESDPNYPQYPESSFRAWHSFFGP